MNKLQQQAKQINDERKKYVKLECIEVPIGITVTKDDGNCKGRIEAADINGIYTTIKDEQFITYTELFNHWLFEIQPGDLRIAGKPDDSGIIIPK